MNTKDATKWTMSREVPVALIVSTLSPIIAFAFWISGWMTRIEAKVEIHEKAITQLLADRDRVTRVETKLDGVSERLDRIGTAVRDIRDQVTGRRNPAP